MTSNKKIVRSSIKYKNDDSSLRDHQQFIKNEQNKLLSQLNSSSLNIHHDANPQQQHNHQTLMNLCEIYKKLFGSDELMAEFQDSSTITNEQITEIAEKVKQQIDRLHEIEYELYQFTHIFEGNQSKLSNQQKWKLVVLSYREKIKNLQIKIREERSSRVMLQETIKLSMQDKERLSQLNNIKHKKINTLVSSLEQKELQLIELNQSIAQMSAHLEQINQSNQMLKQSNSVLQQQITQLNSIRIQQSQQLEQKQRLLMNPQNEKQIIELNVLGQQELQVHKQIVDLKTKYQTEIAKLEYKISNLIISNKQDIQIIEELRHRLQLFEMVRITSIDEQTQTQTQVVKACFFNSLAQDIEDQYDNSVVDSESFRACDQQNKSEGDDQFHIPIGSHSRQNNLTFTDRSVEMHYERETLSEREVSNPNLEMSFDDQRSLSNSPSKYVETMSQLTAQLAEAYEKINSLTSKVGELEQEKNRIQYKIKDHDVRREKPKDKQALGYFSSFFKK